MSSEPMAAEHDLRKTAQGIFLASLASLDLRAALHRKIDRIGPVLRIQGKEYDLARFPHVVVIAIGKAAAPMTEALLERLEPLPVGTQLEGFVVGSTRPSRREPRLHYCLGSHPLPDAASLVAADLILQLLARCDAQSLVFFLISGGSSAMIERPLLPGLRLEELALFYQQLVHSGLGIAEMNTLRKHLSAVKGGRLAVAAGEATMCTLLISDVSPNRPEIIGSGPSLPDHSTVEDCRELLRTKLRGTPIAPSIHGWFESESCPETPKPEHPAFRNAGWGTLLSSDDLCEAARDAAISRSFETVIDLGCDEWDYRDAAAYLLSRLRDLESNLESRNRPVCLISAGELAVRVSARHGLGGRNQQFALECARHIALSSRPIVVLSAGSDGIDGNSLAAGAVVDNSTLGRARLIGLDVERALAEFDTAPLLQRLGEAIITGPTGNNLRDLRLLLMLPKSSPA